METAERYVPPASSPIRLKIVEPSGYSVIHIDTNYMVNRGPSYRLYNTTSFMDTTLNEVNDVFGFVEQLRHKARHHDSGITYILVEQNTIRVTYSPAADAEQVMSLTRAAIRTTGARLKTRLEFV